MNKMKTMLATGIAMAALLVTTTGVFAEASATATVEDDGVADSFVKDVDVFEVDNHNCDADLFNVDFGAGVSGLNLQSGNEDHNSLKTGKSEGSADSQNFANSNVTEVDESESGDPAESEATVGSNEEADADAIDIDIFKVFNYNDADATNLTLGLAVSGGNFQFCNEDDNEIETGDSEADATTLNELNSNWTQIGGLDDSDGVMALATVEDDGVADAFAKDVDVIKVFNHNDADLFNLTGAVAVSGANTQSGNEDENTLKTGRAVADSSAENYLNSNITVVNSLDDGGSQATASVGDAAGDGCGACTGPKDEVTSSATSIDIDKVEVKNHNDADVTNVSAGVAVSGGNTQSHDEDTNSLTTGSSSGSSNSVNTVNSNWTSIGSGISGCGMPSCQH
jgi:hypothetical protein